MYSSVFLMSFMNVGPEIKPPEFTCARRGWPMLLDARGNQLQLPTQVLFQRVRHVVRGTPRVRM